MKKVLGLLVVGLAACATAQPVRNRVERANDRQDLRQDRRQLVNDAKDLGDVNALLAQYDLALSKNDAVGIKAVDAQFQNYLAKEAVEANREAAQAQQEVRQDRREVRGDRRELGGDLARGKRPGVVADDARDLGRDKVNTMDDRSDAARERNARNRLFLIRGELAPLQGLVDPAATARKRALYAEVVNLAKNDLARTKVEQGEDRRELREDRRETREDRR
ncbi:MAG: hypothetical protein JNM69_35795 [Archangium sp.]|nr:hypothetical protein [Archangium sp.]